MSTVYYVKLITLRLGKKIKEIDTYLLKQKQLNIKVD